MADDLISRQAVIDQIRWERDLAIEQLNELGYGLGEKIIKCRDCKYYETAKNGCNGKCDLNIDAFVIFYPDDYCSFGEGKNG